MVSQASLYFHIPFCRKKCPYCHFYVTRDDEQQKDALLDAFLIEYAHWQPRLPSVASIYFGGGTPALFGPSRIARLLGALGPLPSEVTLEANPDGLTPPLLAAYRAAGITRLSLGVQSFDDDELALLGRTHSAQHAATICRAAVDAGISNISIDLMYEVPRQTPASFQRSLDVAVGLPVTHLSLYNLTFEPHTPFARQEEALRRLVVTADEGASMYTSAIATLEEGGFSQYEISAFCRNGMASHHNLGYWIGRPFLGFGPSAWSYWGGTRFRNCPNLQRYLANPTAAADEHDDVTPEARRRELLAVGLRVCSGVDIEALGPLEESTHRSLQQLTADGLVEQHANSFRLTPRGRLFYDSVATALI